MDYRRIWAPGATYFFTVNLLQRRNNQLLVQRIDALKEAVRATRQRFPFSLDASVVLPEHMHVIWTLPKGDADNATRWRLIKAGFSKRIESGEHRSEVRLRRGERGIWQRRFWDHLIRDEQDLARHIDYVHINPMKHGHVKRVADWPHSSFHRFVEKGIYPANWACDPIHIMAGEA